MRKTLAVAVLLLPFTGGGRVESQELLIGTAASLRATLASHKAQLRREQLQKLMDSFSEKALEADKLTGVIAEAILPKERGDIAEAERGIVAAGTEALNAGDAVALLEPKAAQCGLKAMRAKLAAYAQRPVPQWKPGAFDATEVCLLRACGLAVPKPEERLERRVAAVKLGRGEQYERRRAREQAEIDERNRREQEAREARERAERERLERERLEREERLRWEEWQRRDWERRRHYHYHDRNRHWEDERRWEREREAERDQERERERERERDRQRERDREEGERERERQRERDRQEEQERLERYRRERQEQADRAEQESRDRQAREAREAQERSEREARQAREAEESRQREEADRARREQEDRERREREERERQEQEERLRKYREEREKQQG